MWEPKKRVLWQLVSAAMTLVAGLHSAIAQSFPKATIERGGQRLVVEILDDEWTIKTRYFEAPIAVNNIVYVGRPSGRLFQFVTADGSTFNGAFVNESIRTGTEGQPNPGIDVRALDAISFQPEPLAAELPGSMWLVVRTGDVYRVSVPSGDFAIKTTFGELVRSWASVKNLAVAGGHAVSVELGSGEEIRGTLADGFPTWTLLSTRQACSLSDVQVAALAAEPPVGVGVVRIQVQTDSDWTKVEFPGRKWALVRYRVVNGGGKLKYAKRSGEGGAISISNPPRQHFAVDAYLTFEPGGAIDAQMVIAKGSIGTSTVVFDAGQKTEQVYRNSGGHHPPYNSMSFTVRLKSR